MFNGKKNIGLRWQAMQDLGKRYAEIFKHAWQHRKETDTKPRLAHEAEFLPAALSLQETPTPAAPHIVMWSLLGFALLALLWSIFGHMDVVAVASGKIIPNSRTKTIQPIETASIKTIYVTDGQAVQAGDPLIDLDATTTQADIERVKNEWSTAQLQGARAKAMLFALEKNRTPPPLVHLITAAQDNVAKIEAEKIIEAQRQVEGMFAEYQAKLTRIRANIARSQAELHSTQTLVQKLQHTLPLTRQRAQDYKTLLDEKFIPTHTYFEKSQQLIEQESDLNHQRSRLNEIEAALHEARSQQLLLLAETRRIALDSLSEAEQKTTNLQQELIKAQSRRKLMQLVAPVDGIVQQLAVHTVGGVVTPAQVLMMIVPKDQPLEVEAFLENKDIGFVYAGQTAEVKVETFPYTKYGTLPATINHVSNDALNDEKRGLIYSTRVKLNKTTMQVDGKSVSLSPGMAVTVEVKTARRRVISYFLSPLLQHQKESLRER